MGRHPRLRIVALAMAIDIAFLLGVGLLEGAGWLSERFAGGLMGAFSLGNVLLLLKWAFDDGDGGPPRGMGSGNATPPAQVLSEGGPRYRDLAYLSATVVVALELLKGGRDIVLCAARAKLLPASHESWP